MARFQCATWGPEWDDLCWCSFFSRLWGRRKVIFQLPASTVLVVETIAMRSGSKELQKSSEFAECTGVLARCTRLQHER